MNENTIAILKSIISEIEDARCMGDFDYEDEKLLELYDVIKIALQ